MLLWWGWLWWPDLAGSVGSNFHGKKGCIVQPVYMLRIILEKRLKINQFGLLALDFRLIGIIHPVDSGQTVVSSLAIVYTDSLKLDRIITGTHPSCPVLSLSMKA